MYGRDHFVFRSKTLGTLALKLCRHRGARLLLQAHPERRNPDLRSVAERHADGDSRSQLCDRLRACMSAHLALSTLHLSIPALPAYAQAQKEILQLCPPASCQNATRGSVARSQRRKPNFTCKRIWLKSVEID